MQKFKVEIEGVTPYMQHRMDDTKLEEWEKNRKLIIERDDIVKEDAVRAEYHAYSDNEGFYIPSEHLIGSFINAGAMVKSKVGNAKKSMKNIVADMLNTIPDFQPATAYIVGYCKRDELERRPVPEAGIEEEKYCRVSGQLMNSDQHWRSFIDLI